MFYTYFKMYLLRQRTRTINQASKCNVIDKKITWPDWLENKDCAMLVFFFLLGFGIKYYKLLIKNNPQLYPSFEINLAVFIYTRSTLDWFQNLTASCPILDKTRTRLYSSYIIIHLDKFLAGNQPGHSRQLGSKYYYS